MPIKKKVHNNHAYFGSWHLELQVSGVKNKSLVARPNETPTKQSSFTYAPAFWLSNFFFHHGTCGPESDFPPPPPPPFFS
jgi:hypothetical protein